MAHFLVTGHTGFKGSWLTLLLKRRGHAVSGIGLDPLPNSLYTRAGLAKDLAADKRVDIRDSLELIESFNEIAPDYLVHLAAQPLVREGYRKPFDTYQTNAIGTLNVLNAAQLTSSLKAQLIVSTDKVYRNCETAAAYSEEDPLGGNDPYSASKAMADILSQEWLGRGGSKPGGIARAGNVIGAGDVSRDRLIPDILRSVSEDNGLSLRYPRATRPWQHVLDCLNGYLMLLEGIEQHPGGTAWNFGPDLETERSVMEVVAMASRYLGHEIRVHEDIPPGLSEFPESTKLVLNSNKAKVDFGWVNKVPFDKAVEWSVCEAEIESDLEFRSEVERQIESFEANDI
jgi:CDP-glucose 4,6-dehydratase